MNLFSLKNKNIAVTGASSGFGHHFAGVLSEAGANVALGARRIDKISDRVGEINASGGNAIGLELDVREPASCQQFIDEAWGYLRSMNPDLEMDDLIDSRVGRLKYAQPVCEPGFAAKIPHVETPIAGLQIADTCFYYPEDRGIAEGIRLGAEMAARVQEGPTR